MTRQRAAAWAVCGVIGGILLVVRLGTVAVWGGYVLIAIGLFRAVQLVMTFMYPAGSIVVSDTQVTLPRGLHRPHPITVAPSEVTSVYFLRRSVPWNRSAPLLVVELGKRALTYPREWFASEADQRHVVHALLRHRDPVETPDDAVVSEPVMLDDHRSAMGEIIGGVILVAIGIGGTAIGYSQAGPGGAYKLFIGPIIAGVLLAWRGINRRSAA